jgi:hypothetical protein
MRLINAVPAVVQARPGHISIYDLPLLTGRLPCGKTASACDQPT